MPQSPLFDLLDGLEFWGPAPLHPPVRHLRADIRNGAISRDRDEAARAATRERTSGGGNLRADGVPGETSTTERLQELTEGLTGASFRAFFNRRVPTRGS